MKKKLFRSAFLVVVWAGALVAASCSSKPEQESTAQAAQVGELKGHSAVMTAIKPGVPGGILVETYHETATVTGIDREKRKVTLVSSDGTKAIFTAGPDVVNFDQIQVGDKVKAMVTQEVAVFVRKSGETSSDGGVTTIALNPVGAKPGGLVADTVEMTAKVTAIDLKKHRATLQFPDGTSKRFNVRSDVDLANQSVGQDVVIRTTDAVAISVEKP